MQLVFFDMKTQSSYPIEVDDALGNHLEDIRLINGHDVYQLVSTVPEEVTQLNSLRVEFETKEFEELYKKFNYATKSDVPKDFTKQFVDVIESEEVQKKYSKFFESIKENKESVYKTLANHYLTYMFMTNRYNEMVESSVKQRKNKSFMLDFSLRYQDVFKIDHYYNKMTLKQVSEELDDLRKLMDIDDRRHAGYNYLITGISAIGKTVTDILPKDKDNSEVINTAIDFSNDKFAKAFKQFDVIFRSVGNYYFDVNKRLETARKGIRNLDPEHPDLAYLKGLKNGVAKFLISTDKYLKDMSKVEDGPERDANFKLIRDAYVKELIQFYEVLDYLYSAFDSDEVTFADPNITKQFDAVWESSVYYKNSNENDWFVRLARLLYKSFNDLFKSVITPEDEFKPEPPAREEKSETTTP